MDNKDQLAQLVEKFKQEFVPGDFLGVLAFVVIYAIELAYLKAHPPGLKRNKKVERAKELGHVVKAHKVRDLMTREERRDGYGLFSALYEYEVDGKKYKYKYSGHIADPQFLDLFWINHPKKAFPYLPRKRMWDSYLAILFPTVVAGLIIAYFRGML